MVKILKSQKSAHGRFWFDNDDLRSIYEYRNIILCILACLHCLIVLTDVSNSRL